MRIGINQPYLFPYKGYFDLIASVDKFVLYDDAKYIKGGWINRNYFPELFTFRLRKHSDYAQINQCYFYDIEADKKQFKRKTGINADRYLNELRQDLNLAFNCSRTLRKICDDLAIFTPFYFSSDYPHGKSVQGVLDIVKALGGDTYVNLPGGKSLYNQKQFGDIKLEFIETKPGPSILCSEELGL
jgi:hypothetical protein